MGVVKNIMVRAIADFSGLIAGSRRAGDSMQNLSDRMNRYTGGMSGALTGVAGKLAALAGIYIGLSGLKTATEDAIKFDAMMETLNNRMGQSSVVFNHWMDTTGKALGLSKSQIAEYGNTYSNMLYDAAKDQEDLANKTSKFLEVSAIIRSKTGLAQEEVSKRMRSAMNMEADGADELGINVRATAVEQSKAFKELAGGVKAFSDLNSGTQKAIMYTYILDEATRRYGTSVSNNASTQTAIFIASLKDLSLSLGQAFLPIWTTVLPALTNLIDWLDRTAKQVGVFMRVMFGYSATDTTKSAQDSTQAFKGQTSAVNSLTDAHKKLAKAKAGVVGFDQINALPDKSDADDAADAVAKATGVDPKKEVSAASNVRNQPVMDDIDSDIGAEGLANRFKKAIQDMQDAWQSFKDAFKEQSGIVIAIESIGGALLLYFGAGAVATLVSFGASFATMMVMEVVPALYAFAIAQSAAFWEITLVVGIIAAVIAAVILMVKYWKEISIWAGKVWADVVAIWGNAWNWFDTQVIDPFVKGWNGAWVSFGKGVRDAWQSLVDAFVGAGTWFWENVLQPIIDFFVDFSVGVGKGALNAFIAFNKPFMAAGTWFRQNVIDPVIEKFGDLKSGVKTAAENAWTAIKDVFSTVGSWFSANIVTPIKNSFASIADGLGNGLVTAFKSVYNTIAGYMNDLINVWNKVTGSNPITSGLQIGVKLPMLAKGGITNGPMAAIIGDNTGGQEVVSPLSNLLGMVTTAVTQAMAFNSQSSNSRQTGDIILNIDGRQAARILKPFFDNENSRGGNVMINTI